MLNVYYQEINFQLYEQSEAISLSAFISEFCFVYFYLI